MAGYLFVHFTGEQKDGEQKSSKWKIVKLEDSH